MLFKPRSIQSTARTHKRMVRAHNPIVRTTALTDQHHTHQPTDTTLTLHVLYDSPRCGIAHVHSPDARTHRRSRTGALSAAQFEPG